MRRVLMLGLVFASSSSFPSQPGHPLDCSDWVFVEPGHTCTPWVPYRCDRTDYPICAGWGSTRAFDNEGRMYRLKETLSVRVELCGGIDNPSQPPQAGDYLTVADTTPTPAAGHGIYFLTTTTYQGQRRGGRRAENGRLAGRDVSALPSCIFPTETSPAQD